MEEEDDDIDALLSAPKVKKEKPENEEQEHGQTDGTGASLKTEESVDAPATLDAIPQAGEPAAEVKKEDVVPSLADPPVVFKKRKGKR